MILALLPDQEYVRLRPTIDEHHMTVLYLGRYDDEEITEKALKEYWKGLLKLWPYQISAQVTAESLFDTPDGWAHVDLIDSPILPDFRALSQDLLEVYGLPMDRTHGFLPHITRRYLRKSASQEMIHHGGRKLNFTFDRVALWAGDLRLEIGLT